MRRLRMQRRNEARLLDIVVGVISTSLTGTLKYSEEFPWPRYYDFRKSG
jgi:hypothetical protein